MNNVWSRISCIFVTLGTLLFVAAGTATAQDISKYYTVMHPEKFDVDWAAFYRTGNQLTKQVQDRFPHHLDLSYGDDPQQRLDLYLPTGQVKDAPLLVFFHGGGFREGNKAHYGYVAGPFAKHGVIVAVVGYRLTIDGFDPEHPNDAWSQDAKNAVVWLYNHIGKYGGQRSAIYLAGHSTGGALVTYLGIDRTWLSKFSIPTQSIKGIVRVSGGGGGSSSAGGTPAHRAAAKLAVNDPVPAAVITFGSKEKSTHMKPAQDLAGKLFAVGADVTFFSLPGANHADTAMALGDEESELFRSSLKMIKRKDL